MQALKNAILGTSSASSSDRAPMNVSSTHFVLNTDVTRTPYPFESFCSATGCFWGAEKMFWRIPGVHSTSVGYIGGRHAHPTYEEVCSGASGHAECVRVTYDPTRVSFADLLAMHWTSHDPTQGDGQGNDRGSQYRSGIYCTTQAQLAMAKDSAKTYGEALRAAGRRNAVTTEIKGPGEVFYFAEDYHQQYLAKPGSRKYCSAQPTGVPMPAAWLKSNGAKFGPGFWAKYGPKPGCTIGVPDAPISREDAIAAA